jgi:predicted glycoside hydrolase/deacetylase ChbG (UPF0249 family)
MVNMPGAAEAAWLSRSAPDLGIGLHVNFTNESEGPVVDLADADACRLELERQFDQFVALMGRLPTHIDSHHHVHRRPRLLPLFLDLAARCGRPLREHSPVKYFKRFYAQWDGETHPEWIGTENLIRLLAAGLGAGFTELGCHPGYVDPEFQSIYNSERGVELHTLCDPMLREWLAGSHVTLVNFGDVARLAATVPAPGAPGTRRATAPGSGAEAR